MGAEWDAMTPAQRLKETKGWTRIVSLVFDRAVEDLRDVIEPYPYALPDEAEDKLKEMVTTTVASVESLRLAILDNLK